MISADTLREQLDYNRETGQFFWRVARSGRKMAKPAGCVSSQTGYVLICIDKKLYLAHRLAWVYWYGEDPGRFLDHIDRDRLNNRIENLRKATHQQNMANTTARSTCASGVKGVSYCKGTGKWRATITFNGKQRSLGRYAEIEKAAKAYADAAVAYYGEFALSALEPNP